MRPAAAAGILTAALLAGCATAEPVVYGPIGEGKVHGYKDRPNPDGGHTVLIVVPVSLTAAEARAWFDRRAGELCPSGVEKTNVFRLDRPAANYTTYSQGVATTNRTFSQYEVEGYVYCKAKAAG